MWNDIAIPTAGLDPAIYSSDIKTGKLVGVATALLPPAYGASVNLTEFLRSNMTLATSVFQSLAFLIVGSPNNGGGTFSMKQTFVDYITVSTSSADFARMQPATQAFVTALIAALAAAETLTAVNAVPPGYTRVFRNGKTFLSFTYGGFTYLVLAKASYSEPA